MLSSVLASSAVALVGLLVTAPAYVDALVTPPGSGSHLGHLAARHVPGVSPNHNALARRKRNVHKNRKRCQQRPSSSSAYNNNSSPPTTSAPAATTTQPPYTPPSKPGSGKLLLAWPNGGDTSIPNSVYFTGKASRYYTWGPQKVPNDNNLAFCAMLWGDNQISSFQNLVVPGYTDCVLGMNEPNQPGQSDMDIYHGAWLWNTYIAPLSYQGYTILGSPATTSAPSGLQWIQGWLDQIQVKPTVICLHWYDVGFDKFQTYVINFYNGSGQRHIWVTEFACQNFNDGPNGVQCTQDQVWSLAQSASAWMDSTDWIDYYAPFGFMRDMQGVNTLNQLMCDANLPPGPDGYPTALGYYFLNSS